MLGDILIQFVLGFPAGVISLLLSGLGIWKKWVTLLIIGGILTIPYMFYLSTASGLPLYLLALFQFGAAYAVRKKRIGLAWSLLIPLLLATLLMAYLTFYSFFAS